jgi:ribosomal RNA-processing protein 12
MGQNRVRAKGGKSARWAKGQSSNSNPAKSKHRTAAKNRYFAFEHGNQGETASAGKLTAAALLRHDAMQGDTTTMEQDDTLSLGMTNKTFDTFASDWTQCANVAFDKLIQKFQIKNANHKEMLAVLAAVTAVIKSQGGKETETEYFAALMSTLEVSNTVENLSAVVRLLSLVIKKVNKEILIVRYSQVCELLLDTLEKHAETQNVALLRGLLGCISVVLRVQPPGVWNLPELNKTFQSLLTYTTHTKPKIRKAGHHAVLAVVRGGEPGPNGLHPAAHTAAQHCLAVIKSSGPADNSILYMMVLLRELLPALPKAQTKQCCETILKLLTLGSNVIISTGFAALYGLFSDRPSPATLPADLNGQIISALYDYKPSINDTGPMISWLAVLQEGILNLNQLNPTLAHSHIHRFCTEAVSCWLSTRPEVVKSAGLALKAVILETMEAVNKETSTKMVEEVAGGLKYQYHTSWSTVLSVLSALVEMVGGRYPELLVPVLQQLAELRGSASPQLEGEADSVVGKAVTVMGPRRVLEAIPLNITGNETDMEFRSSWIIPVLRDNIRKTELAFFTEYFLPLAGRCLDRSKICAEKEEAIGAKTYEVLTYQMWSLLPGFCVSPTDLTSSFKNLARILGTQLTARKEIRLDILTSLRHLITSTLEDVEGRTELAKFSKNFLPILFNLFTSRPAGSEEAGQRLAALETIKTFFKISDKDLLCSMFDKAMEKGQAEEIDAFTKDAVQDLLRCLLSHVDMDRIQILYNSSLQRITSKDNKEQKKTYKMIEEICKCDTEAAKQFFESSLPELQTTLVSSLSRISPSSQAPRLRCLISIISKLQAPSYEFVYASIPESVLCIRAVNKRARDSAFTLLTCVGEALIRWEPENKDQAVRKLLEQVMVGLAGSPTLIHCSILAICRIYFQLKDILPLDVIEQVLTNILLLLTSSSREVASAGLSFIKVFITSTPVTTAARFLPQIMKGLTEMPEDCKRHCRQKTKFLMERFSRKFGFDLVASLVPKSDLTTQKRLRNIRKEVARRSRKVSEDGSGGDEDDSGLKGRQNTMSEMLADSSDDEFDEQEETKSKRGARKGTWIQEGDGILDLLSSSAAQQISSTKPAQAKVKVEDEKKRVRKSDFKIGADGKIIITEKGGKDDDDDDEVKHKPIDFDKSDEEATFEDLVHTKKRKIGSEAGSVKSRMTSASTSRQSTVGVDAKKYRPGGSGIHRKLDAPGQEYKSKQGHGDVKKKNKPDPYAYIPLTHKTLNKRKGSKSKSVFANVVAAAKKGANKGSKYKVKEVKKMMEGMKM